MVYETQEPGVREVLDSKARLVALADSSRRLKVNVAWVGEREAVGRMWLSARMGEPLRTNSSRLPTPSASGSAVGSFCSAERVWNEFIHDSNGVDEGPEVTIREPVPEKKDP